MGPEAGTTACIAARVARVGSGRVARVGSVILTCTCLTARAVTHASGPASVLQTPVMTAAEERLADALAI